MVSCLYLCCIESSLAVWQSYLGLNLCAATREGFKQNVPISKPKSGQNAGQNLHRDSAPKEIRTQLHLHWLLQLQLQLRDSICSFSFSLQRQLSLNVHRTLARHVATQSLRPCGKETERNAAPKTDIYTVSPAPTSRPRPRPTRLQLQLGSILVHLVSRKKPTRHTKSCCRRKCCCLPASSYSLHLFSLSLCTSSPSLSLLLLLPLPSAAVRVNSFG